jgi:hypothetical protein
VATDTAKRLSGPALLTGSAATVYTVPASTTTVLRNIHVCNETGTAATLTMSIGTDGAGKRLFMGFSVAANDVLDWSGAIIMNAAEVLQAFSGTASALTLTTSGVETA